MMFRPFNIAATLTLLLLAIALPTARAQSTQPAAKAAPTLKWGDDAPPLKFIKWIKGTPVERFEPGKIYVLEFWATWCGPCKAVMPHLSALAKKYGGKVTFIGVNTWEEADDPLPAVEEFVQQQADNMAYNVAADEPGRGGFMARHWLDPAGAEGVPATFVIADRKLVWTGHPNQLAPVLEQLVNKTYDLAATLKAHQDEQALYADINHFIKAVNEKLAAKDYAGAVALLDSKAAQRLPERQKLWADRARFAALLHVDEKRALEYANEQYATPRGNLMRRHFGQAIAEAGEKDGAALSKETYLFGAASLEKAGELGPGFTTSAVFHEFKAICYARGGDAANAVTTMRKALDVAHSPYSTPKPELIAQLNARLAEYKKVAGDTSVEPPRVARKRPAKVYDETADAKHQIAAALANAKKNNRRVLIQWGGNWCAWCLRLSELMTTDKAIARMLASNYELVHIDTARPEDKNMDLGRSYGADFEKSGFPHLTILDADGKVLINQPTSSMEIGTIDAGHDPAKVLSLLRTHAVDPQAGALSAAEAAAYQQSLPPPPKQAIGQPMELRFTDAISGKSVDVQKDLKGKVVVIDFWATWCAPCIADMPRMKELYSKYNAQGVEFIGVSLDKSEAEGGLARLKNFVAEHKIAWPQHYEGKYLFGEFARSWGVSQLPAMFIVDADGKLFSTNARGEIETLIPQLLAKREGKAAAAN